MTNYSLEEEEKVLLDFLKWSGGPEDNRDSKKKSRIQSYVLAVFLFSISAILFYISMPNVYQILGGLSMLGGIVFISMASIISGSTYNLKYTEKYIDTESMRKRLEEIRLNKPKQQGPSGWTG